MEIVGFLASNINLMFYLAALLLAAYVAWKMVKGPTRTGADQTPRIKPIPYSDAYPTIRANPGVLAGVLCFLTGGMPVLIGFPLLLLIFFAIGLSSVLYFRKKYGKMDWESFVFTAGIAVSAIATWLLTKWQSQWVVPPQIWVTLLCIGLVITFVSLLLKGRSVRHSWKRIQARCIDREIRQEHADDPDGGKVWRFQLLCEFEMEGRTFRVTPSFWRSFATRGGVTRFLDRRISPEGGCELYVNPDNPLETEFVGKDLKDFLLH